MKTGIKNGYILFVADDCTTNTEQNNILNALSRKPHKTDGVGYRLTENLEWEPFKIVHGGK